MLLRYLVVLRLPDIIYTATIIIWISRYYIIKLRYIKIKMFSAIVRLIPSLIFNVKMILLQTKVLKNVKIEQSYSKILLLLNDDKIQTY